ncbi:MAG: hypothetical protein ABEI78_00350, partial [Candidatus Nanohaloarchaea archaeon]
MKKLTILLISVITIVGFSAAQDTSYKEGSDAITDYRFNLDGQVYKSSNPDVYSPDGSQSYSDEYDPRVTMTGEVSFKTGGYSIGTTSKKSSNGDMVTFIVKASSPNEDFATQVDKKFVGESVKVPPGQYTGVVELYLDDNLVHETKEKVVVRNYTDKTEDEDRNLNFSKKPDQERAEFSNMDREELITEIKRLRGLVQQLREENRAESSQTENKETSTTRKENRNEEESSAANRSEENSQEETSTTRKENRNEEESSAANRSEENSQEETSTTRKENRNEEESSAA